MLALYDLKTKPWEYYAHGEHSHGFNVQGLLGYPAPLNSIHVLKSSIVLTIITDLMRRLQVIFSVGPFRLTFAWAKRDNVVKSEAARTFFNSGINRLLADVAKVFISFKNTAIVDCLGRRFFQTGLAFSAIVKSFLWVCLILLFTSLSYLLVMSCIMISSGLANSLSISRPVQFVLFHFFLPIVGVACIVDSCVFFFSLTFAYIAIGSAPILTGSRYSKLVESLFNSTSCANFGREQRELIGVVYFAHDRNQLSVITPPVVSATRGQNHVNSTSSVYHRSASQARLCLFFRMKGGD